MDTLKLQRRWDRLDAEGKPRISVSMRLPKNMADRLRKIATSEKRTVQKQLEWIVEQYIDEYEQCHRIPRR